MLIDWFTVCAQVVNFLILMWLLKRFLYKPILGAIDAREAHIADTVKKAEDEQKAAGLELDDLKKKNVAFDLERGHLLAVAQDEARDAGRKLLAKEREAADDAREKWRDSLAAEQRRFGEEVTGRVRTEIFAVLRQAFGDLADEQLETRMLDVFARRLREAKDTLAGMSSSGESFLVKTAFPLTEERQSALRQTFGDILGRGVKRGADLRFQTEPGLVCGAELVAGGRKLAWTLEDYLGRLEGTVADLVEDKR